MHVHGRELGKYRGVARVRDWNAKRAMAIDAREGGSWALMGGEVARLLGDGIEARG